MKSLITRRLFQLLLVASFFVVSAATTRFASPVRADGGAMLITGITVSGTSVTVNGWAEAGVTSYFETCDGHLATSQYSDYFYNFSIEGAQPPLTQIQYANDCSCCQNIGRNRYTFTYTFTNSTPGTYEVQARAFVGRRDDLIATSGSGIDFEVRTHASYTIQ